MKKVLFFMVSLLVLTALACGFNVSTANIAAAKTAKDANGKNPATTFEPSDTFYAVVDLANAPDDTTVKAVWTAVAADGVAPNHVIDEATLTSGGGTLQFNLTNDKMWPAGKYKVDLYLNDKLDRTLEFEVKGEAAAPPPTDTPEPTPTSAPEEEPTSTPKSSVGDTLGGGQKSAETEITPAAEAEATAEALPLQAEPYQHPSEAFSVSVPKGWSLHSEDNLSVAFGDEQSRFGVVFLNTAEPFTEEGLKAFIKKSLDTIVNTFADNYEVTSEKNSLKENNLYYVGTSFSKGKGNADFFFEQYDNTIFIFYFTSLQYAKMLPTRDAILDTYKIDVDAALKADPIATPTPPPAAKPKPKPTPKPAAVNPFKPPAGVARVYMQNEYGNEYNIDFGDGAGSIHVMPNAQSFYHDLPPGKYRPGLSLPGKGALNIEFEIAADQAWLIIVTGDARVRSGQVYP